MLPAPAIAAILTPFVLWRVYQRVRRLMVRQRSQLWRHRLSIGIMSVLVLLFGVMALHQPLSLAALGGGIVAGVLLAMVALRRTQFEQVGADFYYVPHAPIGALVALLFLGRLAYRAYEVFMHGPQAGAQFASSPLTLGVFGVMAGYYACYAGGLLRWRARSA